VFFTRRQLACPLGGGLLPVAAGKLDGWLDEHDVLDGSPFLLDPGGRYDVALNRYFLAGLGLLAANTQAAAAYDLKKFLAFLQDNRGGRSWRDATAADRAAFRQWRLAGPGGPRVALTTWDREVATVSEFYRWAVQEQYVSVSPVVQRQSRGRDPRRRAGGTPAEASHQGPRNNLVWLPAGVYRQWRDVGVRGLTVAGLPDPGFRGRYASRKAAYTDLMLRTGLRKHAQGEGRHIPQGTQAIF
jgi:hypothetical protein